MKEKEVTREILHTYEKIEAEIFDDPVEGSEVIADIIIKAINDHCKGPGKDRLFKLGLTTGTTPVSLYNWLASKYKGGEVSFRNVEKAWIYIVDGKFVRFLENPTLITTDFGSGTFIVKMQNNHVIRSRKITVK